ncbi:sigma factor-like helix-turn-helix DNA-binding protein [Micromonospora sp. BRA006-A]|nr:sigma factor-like helix-turn-helix DNA-binding protein [Micromonospora sp. BRA006-A]
MLKDHDRRQREAAVAPEDLPPSSHSDIADVWEAQETLRGWLHQLPARHAEVFQMSREGFSNQEIAGILGLTENSVRSYKTAARKRLGELAEEAGFTRSERDRRQGRAVDLDDILALAETRPSPLELARARRVARTVQSQYDLSLAEGYEIIVDTDLVDPLTWDAGEATRVARAAQLAKRGTVTWLAGAGQTDVPSGSPGPTRWP